MNKNLMLLGALGLAYVVYSRSTLGGSGAAESSPTGQAIQAPIGTTTPAQISNNVWASTSTDGGITYTRANGTVIPTAGNQYHPGLPLDKASAMTQLYDQFIAARNQILWSR